MARKESTHYELYGKKWYEANREKELLRNREYYNKNKEKKRSKYLSRRDQILQQRYGITEEQYDLLFDLQEGCCAICKQRFAKRLDVDHCHDTGTVRGLLCNNCNRGLGHFKDNVDYLQSAINYLQNVCIIGGKGGSCGV